MRAAAVLAVLILSTGCASRSAPPPVRAAAPVRIVVAATTDLHGWVDGRSYTPPDGVAPARTGGLDVMAAYVDALRARHAGRVVLLDAGDLFQGTLASNVFEGRPVVEAYAKLGVTAAAVGNHEFDYGPVGPRSVALGPEDDPLGALLENVRRAPFPFLAANLTERSTGRRPAWVKPHLLVELDGVELGIVGLATPETPATTTAENVATLEFGDPVAAAISSAEELRSRGADAVVVVAHMGLVCSGAGTDVHDVSSCEGDSDLLELARALPPGLVDGFFGGHTHRVNHRVVAGTPVMQPAPFSQGMAVVELDVDPGAGRVVRSEARHVDVCERVYEGTTGCDPRRAPKGVALAPATFLGEPVTPRADVTALLRPYLQEVDARLAEKLGVRIGAPFTRDYDRGSTLGALVADAMLSAVPGADFAITNSGGLRADLVAPEPTYGDLYAVLPFDNLLATVRVTGVELRSLLGHSGTAGHGSFQVAGLRVKLDYAQPPGAARVVELVAADGREIRDEASYTVVTNEFLARGGGNFDDLVASLPAERVVILFDRGPLRDEVVAELKRMGSAAPLSPVADGRLTVLNAPAPAHGAGAVRQ